MQTDQYSINCEHWPILQTLLDSVKEISVALQHTPVMKLTSVNQFGD